MRPSTLAPNSRIPEYPRLRPVEPHWVERQGQPCLYLRDPLNLSHLVVLLPQRVAPIVAFLDGERTISELRASMALLAGVTLTEGDLSDVVAQLDKALLIENGSYVEAVREALEAYRTAEFRPPVHAGIIYPRRPDELEKALDEYLAAVDDPGPRPATGALAGMICPHIDYRRGHRTYSSLWRAAAPDLDGIELAVILGTDHNGSPGRITLTHQRYATPYGTLPTDTEVVRRLASAMRGADVFGEEIHHASEHSVELAAVWLHHFTRRRNVRLVPVLCGSFGHVTSGGADPGDVGQLEVFLDVMGDVMAERRTLVIAAGDLAHVGPAFGDRSPLDGVARAALASADRNSIDSIVAGDPDGFLEHSRREADARKICGLSAIYLTLRLLKGARGEAFGYDQCPADDRNGSVVSIVGTLLYHD